MTAETKPDRAPALTKTVEKALEYADRRGPRLTAQGRPGEINICSILDDIIENAARFAESYACDALVGIDGLRRLVGTDTTAFNDTDRRVICVAIADRRVDGMDTMMRVLTRGKNQYDPYAHVRQNYRRVIAIDVRKSEDGDLTVKLYHITDDLNRIEDEDFDYASLDRPEPV